MLFYALVVPSATEKFLALARMLQWVLTCIKIRNRVSPSAEWFMNIYLVKRQMTTAFPVFLMHFLQSESKMLNEAECLRAHLYKLGLTASPSVTRFWHLCKFPTAPNPANMEHGQWKVWVCASLYMYPSIFPSYPCGLVVSCKDAVSPSARLILLSKILDVQNMCLLLVVASCSSGNPRKILDHLHERQLG